MISNELDRLNAMLEKAGMCKLMSVNPRECKGQDVNARYMDSSTFNQLVENVKKDKRLESMPLCYIEDGTVRIISGHHRIKAAEELGFEEILVMITEIDSDDEVKAKQLSHNAITGKDDLQVLNELFESIEDISLKYYSGLNNEIQKLNYLSLNFKVGTFKEFTVAFIPDDIDEYDNKMEEIAKEIILKPTSTVRLAPLSQFEKFAKLLRQIKKVENIKSNGTAFIRMIELATKQMTDVHKAEKD